MNDKIKGIVNILKTANTYQEIDSNIELFEIAFDSISQMHKYFIKVNNQKYSLWEYALKATLNLPREINDNALYLAAFFKNIGMICKKTKNYDVEDSSGKYHTKIDDKTIDITSNLIYQNFSLAEYDRYIYYIKEFDSNVLYDISYFERQFELKVDYENLCNLMYLKIAYGKLNNDSQILIYERIISEDGKKLWNRTYEAIKENRNNSKGMKIRFINKADLLGEFILSNVSLSHSDWPNSRFDISFDTSNQGSFNIRMEYFGSIKCFMFVKQKLDGIIYCYVYGFRSSIFDKHMIRIIKSYIRELRDEISLCEKIVDFINEVLLKGKPDDMIGVITGIRYVDYDAFCCDNGGIGNVIWKKIEKD